MGLGLVLISCTAPIYDRAEIHPGPSFTLGVGGGTGAGVVNLFDYSDTLRYYPHAIGTLGLGYGFSRKLCLVLEGSWLSFSWYDLKLGLKIKTGRNGALIPSIGSGIALSS